MVLVFSNICTVLMYGTAQVKLDTQMLTHFSRTIANCTTVYWNCPFTNSCEIITWNDGFSYMYNQKLWSGSCQVMVCWICSFIPEIYAWDIRIATHALVQNQNTKHWIHKTSSIAQTCTYVLSFKISLLKVVGLS